MDFIIQVLNTPNEPRNKSGAMHMMESLACILLRVNTWRVFDSLLTYENNARFMGGAIGFFLLHCFPSVLWRLSDMKGIWPVKSSNKIQNFGILIPAYSYSWEGKGRYGSFRLRMNVWVCWVKLWNPLSTRAIPERFCGHDSLWRGAISSVCIFTFTLPSPGLYQKMVIKQLLLFYLL